MSGDEQQRARELAEGVARRLHIVNEEAVASAVEAGAQVGLITIAVVGQELYTYGNMDRDDLIAVLSVLVASVEHTKPEAEG